MASPSALCLIFFFVAAGALAYKADVPPVLLEDISPLDEASAKFLKNQLDNGLVLNTPKVCQSLGFFCQPTGHHVHNSDLSMNHQGPHVSRGRKFLDAAFKNNHAVLRRGGQDEQVPVTIAWGLPNDASRWTIASDQVPITIAWGPQNRAKQSLLGDQVPVTIAWVPQDNAKEASKPGDQVPITIAWGPQDSAKQALLGDQVPVTIAWVPQENAKEASKPGDQVPVTIAWGPQDSAKQPLLGDQVPVTIAWVPQENAKQASKPGDQVPVTIAWGPQDNAGGEQEQHQHQEHKGDKDKKKAFSGRAFRLAVLHPGKSIPLPRIGGTVRNKLVHPLLADSMPFKYESLAQVMKIFNIPPYSPMGSTMALSVQLGSRVTNDLEVRKSVVSIEEMVEFAGRILCNKALGEDCHLHSVAQSFENRSPVTVTIVDVEKIADDAVACHTIPFPYKVYVCHKIIESTVYKVTVEESGETKTLPVMCHMNTSKFRANHPAFKELNMKPGDGEVCHWMAYKTVVWYA